MEELSLDSPDFRSTYLSLCAEVPFEEEDTIPFLYPEDGSPAFDSPADFPSYP